MQQKRKRRAFESAKNEDSAIYHYTVLCQASIKNRKEALLCRGRLINFKSIVSKFTSICSVNKPLLSDILWRVTSFFFNGASVVLSHP